MTFREDVLAHEEYGYELRVLYEDGLSINEIAKLEQTHPRRVRIFIRSVGGKIRKCGKTSHGLHEHPLYSVWCHMKQRCSNPNDSSYRRYGGRGIKICKQWIRNPVKFIKWGIKNGWREGLSIDRINNDGDYEPCNCRFATDKVQSNNNSRNVIIEYQGQLMSLTNAIAASGTAIKYATVLYRIKTRKMTFIEAITTPLASQNLCKK